MALTSFLLLVAASFAQAHFSIEYPTWRADTLKNKSYDQWLNPCKSPLLLLLSPFICPET
jgi:hypothetical protein